jgi:hypothetical protein
VAPVPPGLHEERGAQPDDERPERHGVLDVRLQQNVARGVRLRLRDEDVALARRQEVGDVEAAFRKLGISSRRQLPDVLGPG